jgi:hypothetical protein
MSEETTETQNPQMSIEEMKERRDEITKYYEEEIPHLKVKAEYEELITKIERAKNERLLGQMQMAQMMAPPMEEGSQEENFKELSNQVKKENKERKLKKQA